MQETDQDGTIRGFALPPPLKGSATPLIPVPSWVREIMELLTTLYRTRLKVAGRIAFLLSCLSSRRLSSPLVSSLPRCFSTGTPEDAPPLHRASSLDSLR